MKINRAVNRSRGVPLMIEGKIGRGDSVEHTPKNVLFA
jgi:hypothetical protein